MTFVVRTPQTSWQLLVPAESLTEEVFGTTSSFGVPANVVVGRSLSTSAGSRRSALTIEPIEAEVRRLRDEVIFRARLTRQQIARAIGVDRRSLSGFVSGSIRPTPSRVDALRSLAGLVAEIDTAYPGRVRDVLLARDDEGADLLDRVAAGDWEALSGWRRAVLRPLAVRISRRNVERRRPPLYEAAVAALVAGRIPEPPPRQPVVRPADLDEISPSEAALFREDSFPKARRQGPE